MKDFLPFIIVGLTSGSVYALAGTGLVLTYKTSAVFNFAHGTVAAAIAYSFYDLRVRQGVPWPIAFLISMLVVAPMVALILERIGRRLTEAPAALKVVATIGLVVGVQQLTIIRYGAQTLRSPAFLPTRTISIAGLNVGIDQLIIMGIGLVCTAGLARLFKATPLGRAMRGVVDNAELLALTGESPTKVRRWAWVIGTALAGLSGILLAPTVGLDTFVLTLLVIQAFGAAALGMFTSIPMTYVGGLLLGVVAALSTRYLSSFPALSGLPQSLPFVALFLVLVVAPRRWLMEVTNERRLPVDEDRHASSRTRVIAAVVIGVVVLWAPSIVGTRLPVYSAGLAMVIILLSLALLIRTSGQISLAQLTFAGIGSATSAHLTVDAGLPWIASVLLGGLVAVPVGAVLAIPAIRRAGLYLALATFGFAVLVERMLFGSSLLFGGRGGSELPAPRPSFAEGDSAYFYLLVVFVAAAILLISALHRSRLGRLLRAMADSPLALAAYGTNVTQLKVIVFCISAFLAGVGGALLGPVTRTTSARSFEVFAGLMLVVVLAIVPGREIGAAIIAAAALAVIPTYFGSESVTRWFPVLFGISAVLVAFRSEGMTVSPRLAAAANRLRPRPERSPIAARLVTANPAMPVQGGQEVG